MRLLSPGIAAVVLACAGIAPAQTAAPAAPFFFHVVDAASGRGVPLVELETVHGVTFVTDNAGIAAIAEPEWSGREIWFHVRSHGYEYPKDGFGYRGVRVVVTPGSSRRLELTRLNVAERLYRITGVDRLRDSRLVGRVAADAEPWSPGGVLGQDSVENAVYKGRLYWFWGDTSRSPYPLGNFAAAGASSRLPGDGGRDPADGVDLRYFVDEHGFARRMCPIDGPGPVWIGGLVVLGAGDDEALYCHYSRMKDLGTRHEHGLARWNDATAQFDKILELPKGSELHPKGHPLRVPAADGGDDWFYFPTPYPSLRVRARLDALVEPASYEAFTCLRPGAHWPERWQEQIDELLHRDAEGALLWAWQVDTDPVAPGRWRELVARGAVQADESWMNLTDVETGAPVCAHAGNVCWNAFRGRWVMVFVEQFGRSFLGEVWYAEAKDLAGPWDRARRVVTHDDYSFYNVAQHPYLAGLGGRYVYFEGTYSKTFSGTERGTPRYDYNQIMYRLDLADPRLHLVP